MNRLLFGQPSRRDNEHFDWLMHRPGEAALVLADEIRFDEQRINEWLKNLGPIQWAAGG